MSTEPPIGSKENPAPLDGYESAKPDEPLFPLQGGDPLGWPLVELWAHLARARAGVIRLNELPQILLKLRESVASGAVEDQREVENLLIRATAAEELSWAMKDYLTGRVAAEGPETAGENLPAEKARLDIYDLRRRLASRLSGLESEINEFLEQFYELGWLQYDDEVAQILRCEIHNLTVLRTDHIEIKRTS